MTFDVLPFGDKWLYLLINAASVSIPFIAGFDKRLKFYREWRFVFPAMLLTMVIFVPWDMLKTSIRVWGFNPKYITGIYIGNLPLEEWLFFLAIPYACIFTYHSLNYLIKPDKFQPFAQIAFKIAGFILVITGIVFYDRLYTTVTFISAGLFLLFHAYFFHKEYSGKFLRMYVITLIPFFIVNGFLTGMMIPQEVVYYNSDENLGIRLITIPLEDTVYGLLMLLMNISWYEFLKLRFAVK